MNTNSNPPKRDLSRKQLGSQSEAEAQCFLENLGWRILERNLRTRRGEIDLIAEEVLQNRRILVFVEVRSRSQVRTLEWVCPPQKVARLKKLAEFHLWRFARKQNYTQVRLDLLVRDPNGWVHYKNISD